MKNYIIAFLTFVSIIAVMQYWEWFMNNFNNFTEGGLVCSGIIGLTLTLVAVLVVPSVLDNTLKDTID